MIYSVGPNATYHEMHEVPWEKLNPGDQVKVNWRPLPYLSKIQLARSGVPGMPIEIIGGNGPNGELTVLDAQNAVEWPGASYFTDQIASQGVFTVAPRGDEGGDYKVSDVAIRNLEIRNATRDAVFTAADGSTQPYNWAAGGIVAYKAQNVTIESCQVHGNENGIFGKSYPDEQGLLRNFLFANNTIWDNGYPNENHYHNVYMECAGIEYRCNWIGPTKEGSGGVGIKDRSAGLVFRYNYVGGGSFCLHLVEPDDSGAFMMAQPDAMVRRVYGNVLVKAPGARTCVLAGWDNVGDFGGGQLFAWNNTLVLVNDVSQADYFFALKVMPQAYAELWNNLITVQGDGDPYLDVSDYGGVGSRINLAGGNWLQSSIQRNYGGPEVKQVDGWDMAARGDDPILDGNFVPSSGSPVRRVAVPIPTGWPEPDTEWVGTAPQPRVSVNDSGAIES